MFLNIKLVIGRFLITTLSTLFNIFKKIDSQNVTTQIDDFERRLCA